MSQRVARIVFSEPLNVDNRLVIQGYGFDARGAVYHNVAHGDHPPMRVDDYALVELPDGTVLACVVTSLGQCFTPLDEAKS